MYYKQNSVFVKFALSLCTLSLFSTCTLAESMVDVFPKPELEGAETSQGEITLDGFRAISAALPEVESRKLDFRSYKTISVWAVGPSLYVYFKNNSLNSPLTGSSGLPKAITVRVRGEDFKVLGSYIWP